MDFVSCSSIFIFNKMAPLDIERANRTSAHTFLRRDGQLEVECSFFPGACCQCKSSLSVLKC